MVSRGGGSGRSVRGSLAAHVVCWRCVQVVRQRDGIIQCINHDQGYDMQTWLYLCGFKAAAVMLTTSWMVRRGRVCVCVCVEGGSYDLNLIVRLPLKGEAALCH
jgi:hypothetical protein